MEKSPGGGDGGGASAGRSSCPCLCCMLLGWMCQDTHVGFRRNSQGPPMAPQQEERWGQQGAVRGPRGGAAGGP